MASNNTNHGTESTVQNNSIDYVLTLSLFQKTLPILIRGLLGAKLAATEGMLSICSIGSRSILVALSVTAPVNAKSSRSMNDKMEK
jgi:hypothetical protein